MAVTYTWSIKDMKRLINEGDVVTAVTFSVTASEGSNSGIITNRVKLAGITSTTSGFADYDSLTESQVIGWVKNRMNNLGTVVSGPPGVSKPGESDMEALAKGAMLESVGVASTVGVGKPW